MDIRRLAQHSIGADFLAAGHFAVVIHLSQFAFGVGQILAVYLHTLDFEAVTRLHGKIEFQHYFPQNLKNRSLFSLAGIPAADL